MTFAPPLTGGAKVMRIIIIRMTFAPPRQGGAKVMRIYTTTDV